MAVTPQQIAAGAALELPRFFDDTFDALGQGEGAYIRDGQPESVTSRVGQAIARGYCRLYGSSPESVQGDASTRVEKACRPYLDSLEPAEPLGIELPFRGGQCEGAIYLVVVTGDNGTGPGDGFSIEIRVRGPIGAAFTTVVSESPPRFNVFLPCGSNFVDALTCGPLTSPFAPAVRRLNGSAGGLAGEPSNVQTSVTACGADDCGNTEPIVRQPEPIGNPLPPPFRFNPGPGIDIDVDVDIGPDGGITFDIGTGPITVNPFPSGEAGGGGANPPTPGEPGGGQDTGAGGGGAGGESGGDAPPGKVLTGVRINILEAPPSRSRFTEEVDRGVAYVYMGEPSEGLGLEPTGALVRDGQFFFAQKDYLTRWAVRAKPGYNLRTTPYYKDAPE